MPQYTPVGVSAQIKGFKNFVNNLGRMRGDIAKTGESTERMAQQTNRAGAMVGDAFRTMATAAVGVIGAQAMIRFGKGAFDASVQVEQLGVATENLSKQIGTTGDEMVATIQKASAGTIDQLTAMQAANKAMLFGIIENKDEMAELTQVAITLGAAMGQDAAKSLDDLTTALGRNSPMILDNLGISLKLSDAYTLYAKSIGKAVDALTEEEKTMAFRKAALIEGKKRMEELGGITETTAIKQERLNRAYSDFQVAFGDLMKGISGGLDPLTAFVDKLTEGAEAWSWILGEGQRALQGYQDELILTSATFEEYFDAVVKAADGNMTLQRRLALTRKAFAEQKTALEEVIFAGLADVDMLKDMSRAQARAAAGTEDLTLATVAYKQGLIRSINARWDAKSASDVLAESQANEEQASKDAKTAADELSAALAAQMQAYRDIQIEQTNYILGLQQSKTDAESAEADYYQNRAGIAQQSNDAVAQADATLKGELAAAEEEWNAIRTQLLGDWDAKGQEQTEADLAWHQAIYENRLSAAHVGHAAELKEIEASGTEQTAAVTAGYEQQKAAQEAANQQALLLAGLRNMEAAGEFEKYEQLAGLSAEEAARGFEAGTIAMTDAIETELAGAMEGLETTAEGAGTTIESNQTKLDTLFDNTAREALVNSAEVNKSLGFMAAGSTTMADEMQTSYEKAQTDWDVLITGMTTTVTAIKWDELGIKAGQDTVDGIIKGVKERVGALETVMFESGEAALAAYERAVGASSPATEFIPLGAAMIEGIMVGMKGEQLALDEVANAIVDSVIMDMLEEAKRVEEVGNEMARDLRIVAKQALAEFVFEEGESIAEGSRRVFDKIVATAESRWPEVTGKLQFLFREVLGDLADEGERVIITLGQKMSDLLGAARVFGGLGGTAAQMLRAREIRPGEERIRAMEDELSLLEEQGTELTRQAELVAEIAVERGKVEEHEKAILAFEEQQQNLRFLEQQIKLLDLIDKYQLDAQQILGGVQLGIGADLTAIMGAMTAALQEVIHVTQAGVFGAAGVDYAAVAPAQATAPATTATTVNQNFGDVNMGNQMSQAQFAAWMQQMIVGAMAS